MRPDSERVDPRAPCADPLVSVVVPTHNRSSMVRRAVESALGQTHSEVEVVLVDDHSSQDIRRTVVRPLRDRGAGELRFCRHGERRGGAAARNTGLEMARGPWIAFLDSDDLWKERKLEKQLRAARGRDVAGSFTGVREVGDAGDRMVRLPDDRRYDRRDLLCINTVGTTSTMMLRTAVVREAGGFDEEMESCQDWDLWLRVTGERSSLVPVCEPLVEYRVHGDRITEDPDAVLQGHWRLVEKHADRLEDEESLLMASCVARALMLKGVALDDPRLIRQGRALLRRVLRASPFRLKDWVRLGLSSLRPSLYAAVARLLAGDRASRA